MKKVAILGAVVALLGLADLFVKGMAEGEVAAKVERSVEGAAGVEADIDSFPFLGRLLVSGEVPELELRVDEITGRSLAITDMVVRMEGVVLDRSRLTSGKAEVTDIDRGSVELTIDAGALARAVPAEVQLSLTGGRLSATVRGRAIASVELTVNEQGALVLQIPPLPAVAIGIPGNTLLPCRPDVALVEDQVHLRCEFDEVPEALLAAANQAS